MKHFAIITLSAAALLFASAPAYAQLGAGEAGQAPSGSPATGPGGPSGPADIPGHVGEQSGPGQGAGAAASPVGPKSAVPGGDVGAGPEPRSAKTGREDAERAAGDAERQRGDRDMTTGAKERDGGDTSIRESAKDAERGDRDAKAGARERDGGDTSNRESAKDAQRGDRNDRGKSAKIDSEQKGKVRSYFSANKPEVKHVERNAVSVSIGVAVPSDIALYSLPPSVVVVAGDCPLHYFVWGDDIVLVDSCSRLVVDIIPGVA